MTSSSLKKTPSVESAHVRKDTMKALILALSLVLLGTTTKAELRLIGGGVICDTIDDAIAHIEKRPAPSCGQLVVYKLATVTPITPYFFNEYRFELVEYTFSEAVEWGNQTQYGFWGPPRPVVELPGALL